MDEIKVQYKFTVQEEGVPDFTDALYFTLDEFQNTPTKTIDEMKKARHDNFKQVIEDANNAPVKSDAVQLEEVTGIETSLKAQLEDITRQKIALQEKVTPPKTGGK